MEAPLPANEEERLRALRRYGILDTPPEAAFDRITRLAAHVLGVPVTHITLIDRNRQWFKSSYGANPQETDRESAFCAHAILDSAVMVVEDARADPRFADNRFVTGESGIRFYAGAPIADEDGFNLGTLCAIDTQPRSFTAEQKTILTDLAAMVVDELERHEARLFFQQLVASGPSLVVQMIPGVYRVTAVSPNVTRVLGYTADEVLHADRFWLSRLHPVDRSRFLAAALTAADAAQEQHVYRLQHKDGGYRWLQCTLRLERDGGKGTDTLLVYAYEVSVPTGEPSPGREAGEDRSLRQQAEMALRESTRRLEAALADLQRAQSQLVQQERLRALGQMASGVAHDFNNCLSPIVGYSELLLADPSLLANTARSERYLKLINQAAKDAGLVVGRLREFYRSRDEDEVRALVDLAAVASETLELTRPRWSDQALTKGITIEARCLCDPVPPVAGNAAELREVLVNLIFNAVDALRDGGSILLRSYLEGERVVLQVQDTGAGMSPEVRARCLEPFFTTKGSQGTGLGLATSYGVIRRHGGTIDVESEIGQGTTFTIRLPADVQQRPGASALEQPSGPLHTLVVDDEPLVREVLAGYLALDGHTSELAGNGKEALATFAAGRFDLVLTDMAMPEMSGDQLALAIKAISPETPILLVSGFGDILAANERLPEGVDAILSKPPTRAQLQQALRDLLTRR